MDLYNISTIVGIVLSTLAIIEKLKGVFDLFNPISRRLNKYLTYNEKYSSCYDLEIQNYLKYQIKYLSLFSLTSVKEENGQLVYLGILQENMKNKINLSLLSDILNTSYIHKDKFVEICSLDCFKIKTSFIVKIIYYVFLSLLISNNLILLPISLCLPNDLSVFKMSLSLLLIVVTPVLVNSVRRNEKPISKKELVYHFAIIEEWNKKIRK